MKFFAALLSLRAFAKQSRIVMVALDCRVGFLKISSHPQAEGHASSQ